MSEYKQKSKTKSAVAEPEIDDIPKVDPETTNIDAILDEIDDVLEENAEEFVKSYIQKGGQ